MATNTPLKNTGKVGSTVFLKVLMALSGLLFVLFVLMHMFGNTKLLSYDSDNGKAFDEYAHHLRTMFTPMLPEHGFLTIFEIILVLGLILHVYSALTLWSRANSAREQDYSIRKRVVGTFSSSMMRWGGIFLFLFILFHIIHFTLPKFNPAGGDTYAELVMVDGHEMATPSHLVVQSFQLWWVVLIYALAMFALGMHLHHGVWSASQTLGIASNPRRAAISKAIGLFLAIVVSVGFMIPPLLILFGVIGK